MTVIILYYPFKSLTLLTLADNNFIKKILEKIF